MKKLALTAVVIVAVVAAASRALRADGAARPSASPGAAAPAKTDREFTLVNIEYEGSKVWVPGVLIVRKGERVKLTLVNNAPSGVHGFSIPDLGVSATVNKGKKEEVSFTADKAGLFRTQCQLHPAHIGGQVLVLE